MAHKHHNVTRQGLCCRGSLHHGSTDPASSRRDACVPHDWYAPILLSSAHWIILILGLGYGSDRFLDVLGVVLLLQFVQVRNRRSICDVLAALLTDGVI